MTAALIAAIVVGSGSILGVVTTRSAPPAHAEGQDTTALDATAEFRPTRPTRLADTRTGTGVTRAADGSIVVTVPDPHATAVAITLTGTNASAAGFVTAWPTGLAQPSTSNLNLTAGATRANHAIVSIGRDQSISIRSNQPTDLIVDMVGVFVPASSASAGRFVATDSTRLIDTRAGGALARGANVHVALPPSVPADASAVSITLTTAASPGPGFLTAYPAGSPLPLASTLNTDGAGQTRATGTIVAVTSAGFDVFSSTGSPVIVDLTGYFTGAGAADSGDGLFVAVPARRVLDTRQDRPVFTGGHVDVPVDGASAVVANITVTDNRAPNYVSVHAANVGHDPTSASTVNTDAVNATVAALTIASASTDGISVYASRTSHVVVDVFGRFTGATRPALVGAPANPNPSVSEDPLRALLVGDSTMSGIRWYTDSHAALAGNVVYTLDMESCRRLIGASCRGREGRVPTNAVAAINSHPGTFDVVVVQTGYNDAPGTFAQAFEQTVAAARAKGARQIVWLTYRTDSTYVNFQFNRAAGSGYATMNRILEEKVASGLFPDVFVADYNTYTARATGAWFTADGVHFRVQGAYGTADYISRYIAFINREACPQPWTVGGQIERPCSDPDAHPLVDAITLYAGNPNAIHCYEVGADRHIECRRDPHLSD